MKNFLIIFTAFFCIPAIHANAQGSAGAEASVESRYIVDMPTAGVLHKGAFSINSMMYNSGGLLIDISTSPFTNFNFGISFSGSNIIGSGDLVWQKFPGIHLRLRLIDETTTFPAILLGLNTQGRGIFDTENERFQTLSPGAFVSASKNFSWLLGNIALHGGMNYSFEPVPSERAPNLYFGIEQSIGDPASISIEYNANIDERSDEFMSDKGLLNAAVRVSIGQGFTMELQVRDLLSNQKDMQGFTRFIGFEFIRRL